MALTNILDVLFSEEEQKQIEIDLKELVRARLKQPLTQNVPVEEVHVKKRRKSKWSEEARAAQAERARERFSKKETAPTAVLSGSEFQALRAVKTGAHWPSEVATRFGNSYPTQRAQNMLHSMVSKGFLSNPREDTKAYFEITEKGLQALEENGIKEPVEE